MLCHLCIRQISLERPSIRHNVHAGRHIRKRPGVVQRSNRRCCLNQSKVRALWLACFCVQVASCKSPAASDRQDEYASKENCGRTGDHDRAWKRWETQLTARAPQGPRSRVPLSLSTLFCSRNEMYGGEEAFLLRVVAVDPGEGKALSDAPN